MRYRKKLPYVYVITIISLYVFVCSASEGNRFIDFSLTNVLDGKTIKSADYHGKGMIAVFGSIYCKPCLELQPILDRVYDENKASGIGIITIYIDNLINLKELQKFVAEHKIRLPFLMDNINIAKKNKVFILPTSFIVDRDGKIIKQYKGFQPYKVYEKEIKRLKAKSSAGDE